MKKVYTDILPEDYFDNLFGKISKTLACGENVCVSVLYGHGNKTVFNFVYGLLQKKHIFDHIIVYNPVHRKESPEDFVRNILVKHTSENVLVIFRFFETMEKRRETLDMLKSLQDEHRHGITYLAIADHSPILDPLAYTATTTVFFSDCIYIQPFSSKQTNMAIDTLNTFYKWNIHAGDYASIFALSGGIGRLIKYISKHLFETNMSVKKIPEYMDTMAISFELDYLTKILITTPKEKVQSLGLTDKKGRIKSSLLRAYCKIYMVNALRMQYQSLSLQEAKIFSYLLAYDGKVISIDKMAQILKMSDENFSLWAIYKIISRLKSKVKKNFKIKSIKNIGYYLVKQGT